MSERKLREMSLGSTGMTKSATPFLLWKPCLRRRDPSQDPEEEWKATANLFSPVVILQTCLRSSYVPGSFLEFQRNEDKPDSQGKGRQ